MAVKKKIKPLTVRAVRSNVGLEKEYRRNENKIDLIAQGESPARVLPKELRGTPQRHQEEVQ